MEFVISTTQTQLLLEHTEKLEAWVYLWIKLKDQVSSECLLDKLSHDYQSEFIIGTAWLWKSRIIN